MKGIGKMIDPEVRSVSLDQIDALCGLADRVGLLTKIKIDAYKTHCDGKKTIAQAKQIIAETDHFMAETTINEESQ